VRVKGNEMFVSVMGDYVFLKSGFVYYESIRLRLNYSLKRFSQIFSTRGFEFIGDSF
jgi:hypothetical protein